MGQEVAVLGNPEGYQGTLSTGIVSGLRKFKRDGELVQFTAPISHGSSGGPVLDEAGRVIGVVRSSHFNEQNLNFAVPVEKLRKLLGRDLAPARGDAPAAAPAQPSGALEVREGADGSITIIQQRPKQ